MSMLVVVCIYRWWWGDMGEVPGREDCWANWQEGHEACQGPGFIALVIALAAPGGAGGRARSPPLRIALPPPAPLSLRCAAARLFAGAAVASKNPAVMGALAEPGSYLWGKLDEVRPRRCLYSRIFLENLCIFRVS